MWSINNELNFYNKNEGFKFTSYNRLSWHNFCKFAARHKQNSALIILSIYFDPKHTFTIGFNSLLRLWLEPRSANTQSVSVHRNYRFQFKPKLHKNFKYKSCHVMHYCSAKYLPKLRSLNKWNHKSRSSFYTNKLDQSQLIRCE